MVEIKQGLGIIILVGIALLIGVVFIDDLADRIFPQVTTSATVNESVTLTSQAGQLASTDIISPSFFGNTSKTAIFDTDLNITSGGVITANASWTDGNYNASYTFFPTDYVKNTSARVLVNLVTLFFAIGLIAIAILSFRKIFLEGK